MERRGRDGAPIRNINAYAMPRFRELAEERRQGGVALPQLGNSGVG